MKRHKKYNIEYQEISPAKLQNLDERQATAMAEFINKLSREREEFSCMVSWMEMGCVPEELKTEWPKESDYIEVKS